MAADLYNLVPESGEVNDLRSNYSMADVPGEARAFGRGVSHVCGCCLEPYLDAALAHVQAEGVAVQPEGVARLAPLGYKHINVLGRYAFIPAEPIAHGQLRPLRNPQDPYAADG